MKRNRFNLTKNCFVEMIYLPNKMFKKDYKCRDFDKCKGLNSYQQLLAFDLQYIIYL